MMNRTQSVALWLGTMGAIIALGIPPDSVRFRLLYNPTTSAPRGWYWVRRANDWNVADYVLTWLPVEAATLADHRQYLPRSVPLLKRIAAAGPQTVCASGGQILIDGRAVAVTRARDGLGRSLVPWTQCRALEQDELFLLSDRNPASFDSRYFGPIRWQNVIGKAIPLWTW